MLPSDDHLGCTDILLLQYRIHRIQSQFWAIIGFTQVTEED